MNELLVKFIQVYLIGDLDTSVIDMWDRRIAMMPNVEDFREYLREQYQDDLNPNPYPSHLELYRKCVKEWPESLSYFQLALACMIWCEEAEKNYLKDRENRINNSPNHMTSQYEEMDRFLPFYKYFQIRQEATSSLEKIIEMEPDLPLDITAYILNIISKIKETKYWEKEVSS